MKKLHYTELRSHPDKFLEDHLKNVANFSKSSFISLKFKHYELFSEISYLIGLCHDFAKSTSFFQNYIVHDMNNENKSHSFLSAMFAYYVVDEYLKENNINFYKNLAIISYIVVLHHHGNIKNIHTLDKYHDDKFDSKLIKKQIKDLKNNCGLCSFYKENNIDLDNFFKKLVNLSFDISDGLSYFEYDSDFDNYFYILLFYSVLLDADKMDASNTVSINREYIPVNIIEDYKKNNSFNNKGINKIREEAFIEVNENVKRVDLSNKIFSINLPTGIGKTLTGFSSALILKDRIYNEFNINPRIIYSLPFLSVIDQNESVIKNIFDESNLKGSNYLLKHNYLADMKYDDGEEEFNISNSKILIEGWNSEVIITTFIQLFNSLIGNKNSYLRKFHNISNSIIILDEIQTIPHCYWAIIQEILKKLADEYNCWIILMTATQPLIFDENDICPLVGDVKYYFDQFDRVEYNFQLEDISLDDFSKNLIDLIDNEKEKDIIVILNTINSSKKLYEIIKQHFIDKNEAIHLDDNGICHVGDSINLIYLSTNIVPHNRLNKINSIKTSYNQNIIISTQLIEAGVDIDVDIVYRDFAPLDSIIQSAGRCNRGYNKYKGIVNIISLINSNGSHFSDYVYEGLLLSTTKEVLKDFNTVSEKDFNLMASQKYFKLISNRSFDDERLREILNNLKFDEISSNFKLIKNLPNKIDVFVCINDDAEKVFNEFKWIYENLSGFERKDAFLKIKNKFYQYVISVDENKFGSANIYCDEIGIINKEDLERKYKRDLGFIFTEDEEPMIW